jgi:Leucine-rich repeat (LRR) protein
MYNRLVNITGLENQVNLVYMNLFHNQIYFLKNLQNLIKLAKLDVGDNNIACIENMEELINLIDFNIENNRVEYIEKLDNHKLAHVNVNCNPITLSHYKDEFDITMPSGVSIDDIYAPFSYSRFEYFMEIYYNIENMSNDQKKYMINKYIKNYKEYNEKEMISVIEIYKEKNKKIELGLSE